jgi:hypothetical protein
MSPIGEQRNRGVGEQAANPMAMAKRGTGEQVAGPTKKKAAKKAANKPAKKAAKKKKK